MGFLVLDMSMSLDGFIAGPDDGPDNGLGVDGHRLHSWLADGDGIDPRTYRPDGPSAVVFDEMMATGAVLVGRRPPPGPPGGAGMAPRPSRPDGPSAGVFDEMMATGGVLVGRRTFDIAGHWDGDHHNGVPIFVPPHPPPADPPTGAATITYV